MRSLQGKLFPADAHLHWTLNMSIYQRENDDNQPGMLITLGRAGPDSCLWEKTT
ncbi:MAG: hypothetical protein MUO62_17225 [Anaerolineales bacterium]|nr:hypothetical protein [Anaerolineales bacterium]